MSHYYIVSVGYTVDLSAFVTLKPFDQSSIVTIMSIQFSPKQAKCP